MRRDPLLALTLMTLGCHGLCACHETYEGPAPAQSEAVATARPLALAQPSSAERTSPMAAYTPDVLARYDEKSACLAVCSAALRCRVDALFSGGSREVGTRLQTCRSRCGGDFPTRVGYLDEARTCLQSGECDKFGACAGSVLATPP